MNRRAQTLIPPPEVVREHLARNLEENRLLRSQLRLSERAAEALRSDPDRREAECQAVAE
jgi:hypothetical protein